MTGTDDSNARAPSMFLPRSRGQVPWPWRACVTKPSIHCIAASAVSTVDGVRRKLALPDRQGGFGFIPHPSMMHVRLAIRRGATGVPSGVRNHNLSMGCDAGMSATSLRAWPVAGTIPVASECYLGSTGRGGDPALGGIASLPRVRALWSHARLRSTMNARRLIARFSA